VDEVLLVSLGVVPTTHRIAQAPIDISSLRKLNFGAAPPSRADMLILIECKGRHAQTPVARTGSKIPVPTSYHHRY
jgi:hypothetical protein